MSDASAPRRVLWVPLRGLRVERTLFATPPVDCGGGVEIYPSPPPSVKAALESDRPGWLIRQTVAATEIEEAEHLPCLVSEESEGLDDDDGRLRGRVHVIEMGLRLTAGSPAGAKFYLSFFPNGQGTCGFVPDFGLVPHESELRGESTTLEPKHIEKIRTFQRTFERLEDEKQRAFERWDLAGRPAGMEPTNQLLRSIRFYHLATRQGVPQWEARFILLATCLETLIHPVSGEAEARFCERIPLLLGLGREEQAPERPRLHRLYQARSRLVHGTWFTRGLMSLADEALVDMERLARRTVVRLFFDQAARAVFASNLSECDADLQIESFFARAAEHVPSPGPEEQSDS